jgi:hypothetical protein
MTYVARNSIHQIAALVPLEATTAAVQICAIACGYLPRLLAAQEGWKDHNVLETAIRYSRLTDEAHKITILLLIFTVK